jgi:hypothetical protein
MNRDDYNLLLEATGMLDNYNPRSRKNIQRKLSVVMRLKKRIIRRRTFLDRILKRY